MMCAYDVQKPVLQNRRERGFIIPSHTAQEVCAKHHQARKQFKKAKLRWRISSGSKRSLGWIPFKKGSAKWVRGQVRFAKQSFNVWDSYGLSGYQFAAGSFSEDRRGRWYFNVAVKIKSKESKGETAIGVDLGLKDVATCSDGVQCIGISKHT